MRILLALLAALICCNNAHASNHYPKTQLNNGELLVSIYLPDAENGYYRGTRFDWSGIIEYVDFKAHRFYAPLHKSHDPYRHDAVSGPAEEFAMFNPMGFDEAKAGETFVKIGVGLLQRDEKKEYLFYRPYKLIHAGKWDIEKGEEWIEFSQTLKGERGWAYDYTKTIRLIPDQPELVIEHRLVNTGNKSIDITHYNHNFTLIDGTPYGPDYTVKFPFSADRPTQIRDIAWHRANKIEVDRPLLDRALKIVAFEGADPGHYNAALVQNNITGASVEFTGNTPIIRMEFWAVERAASPEPFISIQLEPGQSKDWSIHYRFKSGTEH